MPNINLQVPGVRWKVPVNLAVVKNRYHMKFGFNRPLLEEIKACMEDRRWDPDNKVWHFPVCERNNFNLKYMMGENVYSPWQQLPDPGVIQTSRTLFEHQRWLAASWLCYKHMVWAAEMGTGKTLAAIEGMEHSGCDTWLWVSTKSALTAVKYEFAKWRSKIIPEFVSYHSLKKRLANWGNAPAPKGVVFDESARIKNPDAQMSKAARYLCTNMRTEYGRDCYILLMSGAPAPKNPTDWWNQCEIAAPGYLRERRPADLLTRLACTDKQESMTGGMWTKVLGWFDDQQRCKHCGKTKEQQCQCYDPADNELDKFYKRMQGLVCVRLKKDCLDLPDKRYEIIELEPPEDMRRLAKVLVDTSGSQMEALLHCRTLSDGFLYQEQVVGQQECDLCEGRLFEIDLESNQKVPCTRCGATGVISKKERTIVEAETPKDAAFKDLLDLHDDSGRIVAYGGFRGTVDRMVRLCHELYWNVIRVDGRGWQMTTPNGDIIDNVDYLREFQDGDINKIAFVGHPRAAGTGLTLTASRSIIYFSNDYDGDSRIQSEDRIHRTGMDLNKGATIYDLCCLPTDKMVMQNLIQKRRLQALTLGDVSHALDLSAMSKDVGSQSVRSGLRSNANAGPRRYG